MAYPLALPFDLTCGAEQWRRALAAQADNVKDRLALIYDARWIAGKGPGLDAEHVAKSSAEVSRGFEPDH